jgi:putative ABC transport system permease protein
MTAAQVLRGGNWGSWFSPPAGVKPIDVDIQPITAGYFDVIRPQLVAGRLITDEELTAGAHVLVVSEGLAAAYWGASPALGQTLLDTGDPLPYTVVGVVKDVRWYSWDEKAVSIYGPYDRLSRAPMFTFVLRVDDPDRVTGDILRAMAGADPRLRPRRAATLDSMFVESIRPRRFQSYVFGSFAAAALAVTGVGIFGLLAMSAARRTREIGVRQALGATRQSVARLLVFEQLGPVLTGLCAGAAMAIWAAKSIEASLYQITTTDPRVWLAAVVVIIAVATIGTLVPAIRASRVDAVTALRIE